MSRVFTSPRCSLHAPQGFPERPGRLEAVISGAVTAGWERSDCASHEGTGEAIGMMHSAGYIERFARAVERGDGLLDSADNPLTPDTLESARAAVDCALEAADWVAGGEGRQAMAAVRPPGHHAEFATAMGFCFFGNIAIAADYLIRRHGAGRVAVFDFDIHHGNGTQHLLEDRADVFFASVHQYPFYPGTGSAAERGRGEGEGSTLNVPLAARTGDAELRMAVEKTVLPALVDFSPDVLLVSAGFDGWHDDPIGGWLLSEAAYGWLGEELSSVAERCCGGRLLSLLEGGYSLDGLESATAAYLLGQGGHGISGAL